MARATANAGLLAPARGDSLPGQLVRSTPRRSQLRKGRFAVDELSSRVDQIDRRQFQTILKHVPVKTVSNLPTLDDRPQ